MEEKKKPSWEGIEEFFATSVIQQAERSTKRWFIAWIITLAALIGTNVYWIYTFNSYEYVSQDGSGVNSINTGTQEDTSIVSENED